MNVSLKSTMAPKAGLKEKVEVIPSCIVSFICTYMYCREIKQGPSFESHTYVQGDRY
jgi:hypothetical protein